MSNRYFGGVRSNTQPSTVGGKGGSASGVWTTTQAAQKTAGANWPAQQTVPGAPTIGTATGGDASASVAFTPPADNGGASITQFTVTSNPGGITAVGVSSPINVTGLTNGVSYTFTVTATNAIGTSAASAASNSVTPAIPAYEVEYLVVAGGGGGGSSTNSYNGGAGGGGAGGYRAGSGLFLTIGQAYSVTVGGGGSGGGAAVAANGGSGGNSSFDTITSAGGGGGGRCSASSNPGISGGSGGGAGGSNGASGSGGSGNTPSTSPSQGNNGGSVPSANLGGGGGGGASAVGSNSGGGVGGAGGNGTSSSITGSAVTRGGGGGGGTHANGTVLPGGSGGGGSGGALNIGPGSGSTNTGGGGGGVGQTQNVAGAPGGSGIVIIRYPGAQRGSGGSVTSSGGFTIHTFTGNGTYTA